MSEDSVEMTNWDSGNLKEVTVIQQVDAVAVYTNTADNIVIRQRSSMGEDDSLIIVPRASVPALIKALKAEAANK